MTKAKLALIILLSAFISSACGTAPLNGPANTLAGKSVTVKVLYGSEKKDWLEIVVRQFNEARKRLPGGATIVVEATPMGSVESADAITSGAIQPTVWSPASSIYVPVLNQAWRAKNADDLVKGKLNDLVLSPVVIAMWKPMAEALGHPRTPIGWADIAKLATSDKGWEQYGYPEWGAFKFGHTHPYFSNSGISAVLGMAYAGSGKQRGLSLEDLKKPEVLAFMENVQKGVIHYGSSTGFFGDRMFERGPSYLSAAVLYENLVVTQEDERIRGKSAQLPVIAIYPKKGTFWSNRPYAILNAPWVTAEQREAALAFEKFLLERPQQLKALEFGFRPADPSIGLGAPLDLAHGADPAQPQTVLEIPTAEVILTAQSTWKAAKKPVDVSVIMDVSGSMQGARIASARQSLQEFIRLLDDRDRLQVVLFSTTLRELSPLTALGPKREDLTRRVGGVIEGGDTRLWDSVLDTIKTMQRDGDPKRIRAVIILTDGEDNKSLASSKAEIIRLTDAKSNEGGAGIKVFAIAYGDSAPAKALKEIAEPSGGKQYNSDPATIRVIYGDIATFF